MLWSAKIRILKVARNGDVSKAQEGWSSVEGAQKALVNAGEKDDVILGPK